jgi:hypothetical protein
MATGLAQSASELCAVQIKIVAQDVEERLIGIPRIDADCTVIDTKFVDRDGFLSPIAAIIQFLSSGLYALR